MAILVQIDCIDKDDQSNPYERIRYVGGPNTSGPLAPDTSRITAALRKRGLAIAERPRWKLPLDEAIQGVLDGKWRFYIQADSHDGLTVRVATSPTGRLYLKTEADRDTPDRLLCLPRCR
jgi:hypothetical protein